MTKFEFLDDLKRALTGEIPQFEIDSNIRYYDDYFTNSSKTDEEIIEEIGDPRLIAKTIIESSKMKYSGNESNKTYNYESYSSDNVNQNYNSGTTKKDVSSTVQKIFLIIVGVIILMGIIAIGSVVLRFLLPVLLILLVIRLFTRRY